jgi:alpha/beta superfamily hydrolase
LIRYPGGHRASLGGKAAPCSTFRRNRRIRAFEIGEGPLTQDERMVTVSPRTDGETLEAVFLAGASEWGAVIAPPHPLYGGSKDSPVVNELASAAQKSDLASLRFNWRGVGASAGERSGEAEHADADYGAALDHLLATVTGDTIVCGYSFGSVAALRAADHPRVAGAVLVAPPPGYFSEDALAKLERSVLVVAAEHDEIAPPEDLEARCAAAAGVKLVVVPDADHFFMTGLAEIGAAATDWFVGLSTA